MRICVHPCAFLVDPCAISDMRQYKCMVWFGTLPVFIQSFTLRPVSVEEKWDSQIPGQTRRRQCQHTGNHCHQLEEQLYDLQKTFNSIVISFPCYMTYSLGSGQLTITMATSRRDNERTKWWWPPVLGNYKYLLSSLYHTPFHSCCLMFTHSQEAEKVSESQAPVSPFSNHWIKPVEFMYSFHDLSGFVAMNTPRPLFWEPS